jgi:hypothetical protein
LLLLLLLLLLLKGCGCRHGCQQTLRPALAATPLAWIELRQPPEVK